MGGRGGPLARTCECVLAGAAEQERNAFMTQITRGPLEAHQPAASRFPPAPESARRTLGLRPCRRDCPAAAARGRESGPLACCCSTDSPRRRRRGASSRCRHVEASRRYGDECQSAPPADAPSSEGR
ncbi:hypothetical protein MRX96_032154 [Rhipicephalus microplus]